jgi:hypothetical protein
MCACVKFGFHLLHLFYLFKIIIFYFVCCNLIISKEKHKVITYLGVGN